jgi:hypothetical protein
MASLIGQVVEIHHYVIWRLCRNLPTLRVQWGLLAVSQSKRQIMDAYAPVSKGGFIGALIRWVPGHTGESERENRWGP